MPSHIFTRRGYWQDSVDSNRVSAEAAKGDNFNQFHAMDYLAYAHLQMAQDQAAKRVLDALTATGKVKMEHFVSGFALATLPSRYALERGRWSEAAALTLYGNEFPWARFPQSEAQLVFARGLGAARSGDVAAAKRDADRLQALRDALTAAKQGYWAEQTEIQRLIVSAWATRAEGKLPEAFQLLRAAVEREDATEKHPVTPGPLAPARELLGEMLLETSQPAEALKEFEATMRVEPNRFRTVAGAARAAELAGDRQRAREHYAKLLTIAAGGDTEREELRQAKTFLGR
jgi:tetratricopeptide (TPR) repeat protein